MAQGKEFACNARDPSSIPGSGRSPGGRNGNPLQYSCLENPMDRGAWRVTVHGLQRVRHDCSNWASRGLLLGLPTLTRAQKLLLRDQSASECGSRTNKLAWLVTMCSYLTMTFLFISWMPFLFKLFSVCWWGNMKSIRYSIICKVGELEIPLFSQVSPTCC